MCIRDRRHSLALVLTGLVAALCCGRDGNLSRLHRHMVNHFEKPVSYTHLDVYKRQVQAKNKYYPIPQDEVNANPELTQNPDWQ